MVNFITKCCRFVITLLVAIVASVQTLPAVVGVIASMAVATVAFAENKTIYVDDSASAGGDGEAWITAYRVLQDAIADAEDHVVNESNTATILVAAGTYFPDRFNDSNTGTGARASTFMLLERVTMEGGYSGSGTTRNPAVYISYLEGDLNEAVDADDNAYHVVTATDADITPQNCVISGFVVRNGFANGSGSGQSLGGGIFLEHAAPKIYACTVKDNFAFVGGGIWCTDTSEITEIRNCRIENNVAGTTSFPGFGGGVGADVGLLILNSTFYNNSAQGDGGGLAVPFVTSAPALNVTLANCRFVHNHSGESGGGVIINRGGNLTVSNCVFNGNSADENSAGIFCGVATLHMKNCTFVHGTAAAGGGLGLYNLDFEDPAIIYNCIFYHNTGGEYPDVLHANFNNDAYLNYSLIQQAETQIFEDHVIHGQNPGFVDHDGENNEAGDLDDDLHVTCGSPGINAGLDTLGTAVAYDSFDVDESSSTPTTGPAPDLDLHARLAGADPDSNRVDLGCYERAPVATCTPDIVPYSPCLNGIVNADDLLAVIFAWGSCPTTEGACPADVANSDDEVDLDDLLAVINGWGACPGYTGGEEEMPQSIEDCMDYCTNMHDPPYGAQWNDCVNTCVQALCEAEIIECD